MKGQGPQPGISHAAGLDLDGRPVRDAVAQRTTVRPVPDRPDDVDHQADPSAVARPGVALEIVDQGSIAAR
jgi:hypothetical protein